MFRELRLLIDCQDNMRRLTTTNNISEVEIVPAYILKQIVSGTTYVAVAITEPDAGRGATAMRSHASTKGVGFSLTGWKLGNAW